MVDSAKAGIVRTIRKARAAMKGETPAIDAVH